MFGSEGPTFARMTSFNLLAIAALVLINGFFVAAEFALVSTRRERLGEDSKAGQLVRRQLNKLDEYLSACQLGITIASLALGALGEPTLAALIEPVLHSTPLAHFGAVIGTIGAILVMTTLHITVGEQAPKSFAIGSAERTAEICALPLEFFYRTLRPLVRILNAASNRLVRVLGGTPASSHAQQASLEELRLLIGGMAAGGHLDRSDQQILEGVFALDERKAQDVMTPRTRLSVVREGMTVVEALTETRGSGHSHFPLLSVKGDPLGIIHHHDLAYAILDGQSEEPVESFRNDLLIAPAPQVLEELLGRMKAAHASLVAIVDEYGQLEGVVTIEDIVEEIVGEIYDEHDPASERRTNGSLETGNLIVFGDTSLLDLADHGVELESDSAISISGLIQEQLGRKLEPGDRAIVAGLRLQVIASSAGRATSVLIAPAS